MKNKIVRYEPMCYEERVECARSIINDASIYDLWGCVADQREADWVLEVMQQRSRNWCLVAKTIRAMLGYGFDSNEALDEEENAHFMDALFAIRAFLDLYSASAWVDSGWYTGHLHQEMDRHFHLGARQFEPVMADVDDIERRLYEREPVTEGERLLLHLLEHGHGFLETVHLNGLDKRDDESSNQ